MREIEYVAGATEVNTPGSSLSSAERDAFEMRAMLYLDGDLATGELPQFNEDLTAQADFP